MVPMISTRKAYDSILHSEAVVTGVDFVNQSNVETMFHTTSNKKRAKFQMVNYGVVSNS